MATERNVFSGVSQKTKTFLLKSIPIASWLPYYNKKWLFGDALAGITVGVMVVPQVLAYAQVVGIPVQYGLYSATFCAMVYCLFGTSKDVNVGPITMLSMLTGQVCSQMVEEYGYNNIDVAVALSFMTGLILLGLGVLRLGIVLDFISVPVIVGFTSGAGIAIMTTQIPGFIGLKGINTRESAIKIIINVFKNIQHATWVDVVIGVCSILVLVSLEQIKKRYGRRHFAVGFLGIAKNAIVIIIFTLTSFLILKTAPGTKISIIREVPKGIAPPRLPNIDTIMMGRLAASALISCLLGLIEHTGVCRSLGRKNKYTVDSNQELVGLGVCNIVCSIFSGFPVSGSFSRGAVNDQSGVKTPLSGVLTGLIVVFALIFLPPLFYYIPNATLSSIIIFSMVSVVSSPKVFHHFWIIDRMEFAVSVLGFLITVFVAIQTGIEVAVCCSIVVLLYRVARPRLKFPTVIQGYEMIGYDTNEVPPGVVVVRLQESLLFPNVEFARRKIMKIVGRRTRPAVSINEELRWNECKPKSKKASTNENILGLPVLEAVIFDMSAVNQVDYSGIQGLLDIKFELCKYAGVVDESQDETFQIHFAAMNPNVAKRIKVCGVLGSKQNFTTVETKDGKATEEVIDLDSKDITPDLIHTSVAEAVASILKYRENLGMDEIDELKSKLK
ncbi:sulfate permease [Basidiobolus meristosporus CBS 931.73]|uniref:Sulfate permease n=1 Tax=Basidiobolus meristosporus CBS 931.73 TaxID=1314790 RepID=A0A1Y1Y501_9FUNG|nr:sulfate permease [Basidiobolus meristosporus CBS 931.73]|eukprot:ORX92975.1 sulfate permease [Basidiobolus meristosporus CBS 931.73]